jgi:hypothetical protein
VGGFDQDEGAAERDKDRSRLTKPTSLAAQHNQLISERRRVFRFKAASPLKWEARMAE